MKIYEHKSWQYCCTNLGHKIHSGYENSDETLYWFKFYSYILQQLLLSVISHTYRQRFVTWSDSSK